MVVPHNVRNTMESRIERVEGAHGERVLVGVLEDGDASETTFYVLLVLCD